MPDVWGHAKDFFDPAIPQGAPNPRRGLLQFRNGGNVPPQVDDLLVFTDRTYGHVAIVAQVRGDRVEVVQQNIVGRPRAELHLAIRDANYTIDSPRVPAGWLRLPPATK
jgi:hypothetical protein